MLELADIFRRHGPEYRAKFGARLLPSHRRAMYDIESCRTEARGGQLYFCAQCQEQRYSYHSCKNRHCPKCQNQQGNQWLAEQKQLLLPTHHFLVTFTLPAELRPLARSNQKTLYHLLFRTASQALLKLARDPRFVGGLLGMVGVLQTWTRDLRYHPHLHFIVTGGGLTQAGQWRASAPDFLVHEKPLAMIFRAKLRDELKKAGLFASVERRVWKKDWVVDCQAVGSGEQAFKYLAPYIFRVALSNNRLRQLENGDVTFAYKESASNQVKSCTLPAEKFIGRFLQHVLPPRFIKVRYYGLLSPSNRPRLQLARQLLSTTAAKPPGPNPAALKTAAPKPLPTCPQCRGPLIPLGPLPPLLSRGRPPLTLLAPLTPRGRPP
jgi:hypothetical protein